MKINDLHDISKKVSALLLIITALFMGSNGCVAGGNVRNVTIPADMIQIKTTTDLAASIGNKIPSRSRKPWVTVIEVSVFNLKTRCQDSYQVWWTGKKWDDLGQSTTVNNKDIYKVAIPTNSGKILWP